MDMTDNFFPFRKGSLRLKKIIQALIECGIHYEIRRGINFIYIKPLFKQMPFLESSKMEHQYNKMKRFKKEPYMDTY